MAFKQVRLGDYFKFEKGLGYKGEFLVEDSNVGLVGIDSQVPGGGYKENSEKAYSGPYKPEHVVDSGDVIVAATDITQDGSVLGSTLMIPESTNYETLIYSGDVMKAIPLKPDEFSLEYFYNLYRVEKYRRKVAYGDTGTTVRRLSEDGICEQLVPLPELSTQLAINEIISLIDQQIANNKSLSRNLEALAQSVFKSWFIDFDPVNAKKNGEKPFGMDTETAKLFPDSFVKSELGDIPKGWNVVKFESLGKIVTGKTPSTKNEAYWGADVPFVTIPDMTRNRFTISAERYLSKLGADSQKNQYLPVGTTSVSCIASPGLVSYSFVDSQTNQQINSIIPNSGTPREWLFFRIDSEIHQIKSRSGIGSVFSNLNKSDFSSLETIFASKELHEKFAEIAAPMLSEIETTTRASQKLIELRTTILDGLVSEKLKLQIESKAS
jgi:type I restriction enzyme S subunit